jgi:glucokinase
VPDATRRAVGVDVGGTAVKLGAIRADAAGIAREAEAVLPVYEATEIEPLLDAVADEVRRLAGPAPLTSLGVGVPGLLDRERGVVLDSPNLPWLTGTPVRAGLAERLALPPDAVRVENDANVAALGEQWLGAARGVPDVLVATLGTGIGGGLILGGELHVGAGLGGELGHVVVAPDGRPCGCGGRGCLETVASATAARRRAKERDLPAGDPGNLEALTAAAEAAPGAERELLLEIGRDLGHGLALAVALLDLRCFVLGGGFAGALDAMEPGIRAGLAEWVYGERVASVSLTPAALGPSAGWIGAARLAHDFPPRGAGDGDAT